MTPRLVFAAIRELATATLIFILCSCGINSFSPYSPHETLLSIAADYQLARAADLYRMEWPQDLTGQNIARATLVRLANYEDLHPGKFTPEIEWLRGQALADLGDYSSARRRFLHCAEFDTALRPGAREAADFAGRFAELFSRAAEADTPEAFLADSSRQIAEWIVMAETCRGTRWEQLALIEREAAETARAEFLDANQILLAGGEARAREAFEALVRNHSQSRRGLGHALRLAEFHLAAARRLDRLHDPERGAFEWTPFAEHLERALDLLYRVGQADGHPEKILAQHRLDEALAYYDLVRRRAH
jgi:hypothetical protein